MNQRKKPFLDGGETVAMVSLDPLEVLHRSLGDHSSPLILHPPQFVELSRMAKMASLDVLIDYAKKRQERGMRRWCPNQYMFKV